MISYVLAAFRMETPRISIASKYFLIRVLAMVGRGTCGANLMELARSVGMSKTTILACRDELLIARSGSSHGEGYLIEEQVPCYSMTGQGGKPRKGFRIAPDFFQQVDLAVAQEEIKRKDDECFGVNDDAVTQLLMSVPVRVARARDAGDGRKKIGQLGRAEELTVPNRLLLALLWDVADSSGAVYVDTKELAGRAGMSLSQLNRQLEKLQRLGAFRDRLPGVWGKGLFRDSVEILNLEPMRLGLESAWRGTRWERYRWDMMDGALGAVDAAFAEAEKLERLERRLREREAQADQGRGDRWGHWLAEQKADLVLRKRVFDGTQHNWGFPSAFADLLKDGEEVSDDQMPGIYSAFLRADIRLRRYVGGVVCHFAARIIACHAAEILGRTEVLSQRILEEIQRRLAPREDGGSIWDRTLALWFYRHAYDVAVELLRWREGIYRQAWLHDEKGKQDATSAQRATGLQDGPEEGVDEKAESDGTANLSSDLEMVLLNGDVFGFYIERWIFINVLVRQKGELSSAEAPVD